jgi:hypothetical protein
MGDHYDDFFRGVQHLRPATWPLRPLTHDQPLFSWSTDGDRAIRSGGVSSEEMTALAGVADAMRTTGAKSGTVSICFLDPSSCSRYTDGRVIAHAELDETTGAIMWGDSPC